MWLRLDVDHASSSKFWNVIRFTTGMKIPNYLDHVKETLRFLEQYNVPQIWFFRRWTCPDSFPEAWQGGNVLNWEGVIVFLKVVRSLIIVIIDDYGFYVAE